MIYQQIGFSRRLDSSGNWSRIFKQGSGIGHEAVYILAPESTAKRNLQETTMSEKLTKEWIADCIKGYVGFIGHDVAADEIWKYVQIDREQTREEVLKDHFKIGEAALVGVSAEPCVIVARVKSSPEDYFFFPGVIARRPPEMRPMTREEKETALREKSLKLALAKDETLDALLAELGIPTEVPE